jgi:uncharacterized protein (DUF433 family)
MHNDRHSFQERITTDPTIMVGKPVVAGTRIPVERILRHLEENDRADLFEAFPELTEEDVRACLAYARAAVERERGEPAGAAGRA